MGVGRKYIWYKYHSERTGISLTERQRKMSGKCYSPQRSWLHFWNLSQAEVQAYLGLIL